ncbi:sortase [Kribbella italica]|uniref:Sortase A n=1 Tax=Kribbella italica TaxID=1540520 RepID=A0A7W9J5X0_9ACTN|nr:sortase A [Kribbella italica]
MRPLWRWIAASTAFVVAITIGIVLFGRDGTPSAAPDADPPPSGGQSQPTAGGTTAAPGEDDEALVNRMLDQLRAGKQVEPQFAAGDNPAAGVPIEAIKARPGEQLRLGRLQIPKLKVDQVLNNGVDEPALVKGVGHWPGTPLPGVAGNSVISGHRSTNGKPFLYLDRLRPGDPIKVTAGSKTTTYKVVKTTIVPEKSYVAFILRKPAKASDKVLTLFACNPLTAHYQRIVVEARAA